MPFLFVSSVARSAAEDTDKNGTVDVNDCRAPSGANDAASLHKGYFTETYTRATQCLNCDGKIGDDVMTTAHWKWEGVSSASLVMEPAFMARRT